ncbi:DUF4230 domain-containing protein [Candidatus Dojkabacteria bacterium]|nr:DUF4230 domain-containing protein [Candidatus Dojkabacteria bacterium]
MTKSIKDTLIIVLTVLTICLISSIIAYLYGMNTAKKLNKKPEEEISTQIILDRIKDQQFLVTKTVYLDESIVIEVEQDSKWDKLLWGETIEAEGLVRLDIGVDINELNSEDILINQKEKKITLTLPEAEILDTSLFGDLEIETQKGIFKNIQEIFDKKEGEDYNRAVEKLIDEASKEISEDEELLREAKEKTNVFEIILQDLDYDIEIK